MEQDIAAQVVGLGGATDFSLWKLFLRADFVVKFVIILLILSSIFSWAHEKIEDSINKIITNFTTKSARRNSFHKEKSVAPPNPTTCAAISCSIKVDYF